jgi:hypothetical protein
MCYVASVRKRDWVIWLLGSSVGVGLVAAPDSDERLFSISRTHGPSLVDAIGSVILVAAWVVLLAGIWKGRHRLPRNRLLWGSVLLVAAMAGALLVWSITGDRGRWWMFGGSVLLSLQLGAAVFATEREIGMESSNEPRQH